MVFTPPFFAFPCSSLGRDFVYRGTFLTHSPFVYRGTKAVPSSVNPLRLSGYGFVVYRGTSSENSKARHIRLSWQFSPIEQTFQCSTRSLRKQLISSSIGVQNQAYPQAFVYRGTEFRLSGYIPIVYRGRPHRLSGYIPFKKHTTNQRLANAIHSLNTRARD